MKSLIKKIVNKINVVNKATHAPTDRDFYVGRGSVLGNPFTSKNIEETKALYQVNSKEEAIEKYSASLKTKINIKEGLIINTLNEMFEALKVGDINLVCYCAPDKCHGDEIKRVLNGMYVKFLMSEN